MVGGVWIVVSTVDSPLACLCEWEEVTRELAANDYKLCTTEERIITAGVTRKSRRKWEQKTLRGE